MGVVRLRRQRLAEHADGRLAPSRLVRYHPQQVERVRLARIVQQHGPISRCRFGQPPGAVVRHRFIQIVRFRRHFTPAPELYLSLVTEPRPKGAVFSSASSCASLAFLRTSGSVKKQISHLLSSSAFVGDHCVPCALTACAKWANMNLLWYIVLDKAQAR